MRSPLASHCGIKRLGRARARVRRLCHGTRRNAGQRYLSQAPWMSIYPGLMIFSVVMALNVLGDALRDALDPRHG